MLGVNMIYQQIHQLFHINLLGHWCHNSDPQAAGKVRDDKAIAWYNLACVAALAQRPDAAVKALKMCMDNLKASERNSWIQEALEDVDLKSVMHLAEMQNLLAQVAVKPKAGYPKKGGLCAVYAV